MPYGKCPACNEYGFIGEKFMPHRCKPEWQARATWVDDDSWESVRADDAEEAAERYAERYDCDGGDYVFLNGRHDDLIVLVRKPEAEMIERFSIQSESIPHYSATKIETPR